MNLYYERLVSLIHPLKVNNVFFENEQNETFIKFILFS